MKTLGILYLFSLINVVFDGFDQSGFVPYLIDILVALPSRGDALRLSGSLAALRKDERQSLRHVLHLFVEGLANLRLDVEVSLKNLSV